jgi:hypothetical protein
MYIAVLPDWESATRPIGSSGETVDRYWLDPNGDTAAVIHRNAASTGANQAQSIGTANLSGDDVNMSGLVILGTK